MNNSSREICLAHAIRRADRIASQLYNEHLAPLGLRITQFSVLRALDTMGTTTAVELQSALVVDQTTVSRSLKPLIRDGVIAVNEGANRREKRLSLTPKGKALYKRACKPWTAAQSKFKQRLGRDLEEALVKLSKKIVETKA